MYCDGCYRTAADDPYPIRLPVDLDGLVVESAAEENRFRYGRAGDNFMTMFQCDLCHFRNIQKRDPVGENGLDRCAMRNIRRANMDALWSREPSTVRANLAMVRKMCDYGESRLGFDSEVMVPAMGPFAVQDDCGMRVAAVSTERSLDKGVNEKTVQHGTVRKFRSAFSNMWHASVEGGLDAVAVRDTSKLIQTSCPTFGEWYERFGLGLHKRMGDKVRQDRAISVDQMKALMEEFEKDWTALAPEGNQDGEREKVLFGALFAVVAWVVALRGEEVPLMDLAGSRKHFSSAVLTGLNEDGVDLSHAVIALLGRFKGETGEKYHYMVTVLKTKSGIEPAKWIGRMLKWYKDRGVKNGPVFRKKNGKPGKAKDYEREIFERLERIQKEQPKILDPSIDIMEEFGMSRSFRRGSDSRAYTEKLGVPIINLNNRWRKVEAAKGKSVSFQMYEHYADISLLLSAFLEYSRAM